MCPMSHVTCHISDFRCQVQNVMCQVSGVRCTIYMYIHFMLLIFFQAGWWRFLLEGVLSKGPTLSSLGITSSPQYDHVEAVLRNLYALIKYQDIKEPSIFC